MAVYIEGTAIIVDAPGDTGSIFFYPEPGTLVGADTLIFGVKIEGREHLPDYVFKREVRVTEDDDLVEIRLRTEDTLNADARRKYSWGMRLRKTEADGTVTYRDTQYNIEPFKVRRATVHD